MHHVLTVIPHDSAITTNQTGNPSIANLALKNTRGSLKWSYMEPAIGKG